MKLWIAIILGTLQGLTEFLPLSSSGHLLLVEHLLGAPTSLFFNILLHVATLLAVVLFFWKDATYCLTHPFSKKSLCLLLSTFCTCCVAIAMSKIPGAMEGIILGPCFLATGTILLATELISLRRRKKAFVPKPLNTNRAFMVGLAQGLAVLPGLSRSGTTISALELSGMDKKEATSYSFLLSIPIIIGGMLFEIIKGSGTSQTIGILPCLLGFLFAFLFGLASLFLLKKLIQKNRWWIFIPYLLILGTVVCIWQYA